MTSSDFAAIGAVGAALIAAIALGVSLRANHHSNRSATAAESSADASRDSASAAREANLRATTSNDVLWKCHWEQFNYQVVLTNRGHDDAHDVQVTLIVDDDRRHETYPIIRADNREVIANLSREVALARQASTPPYSDRIRLMWRVTWRDAANRPYSHDGGQFHIGW